MAWPAWWGVVILFALVLDAILIPDALYQIASGRPSFLPFERMLRKRVPATPTDCLLQGTSKLLIYVGVLLVQLPLFGISYLTASGSPLGPQPGGLWVEHAVAIGMMGCAGMATVLFVSAAIVESKVRFTYFERPVNEP
jgi:hypothetical protein